MEPGSEEPGDLVALPHDPQVAGELQWSRAPKSPVTAVRGNGQLCQAFWLQWSRAPKSPVTRYDPRRSGIFRRASMEPGSEEPGDRSLSGFVPTAVEGFMEPGSEEPGDNHASVRPSPSEWRFNEPGSEEPGDHPGQAWAPEPLSRLQWSRAPKSPVTRAWTCDVEGSDRASMEPGSEEPGDP